MPSKHQSAGELVAYESAAEKYLREKNMRTVVALVDGIRREERAREWLGACNKVGVNDHVHERVVGKVRELSD
jgi:hypothetical protein